MSHATIAGMTESGKTFAGIELAKGFRAAGVGTLVLHKPMEQWPAAAASWQTDSIERFLPMFERSRGCAVFMELSDAAVSKYDARVHRCFTAGRHFGHRVHFITQRPATVHPAIRENCTALYLFNCATNAAKMWAEEFNDAALLEADRLPQYVFLHKASRFAPAVRRKFSV
ncbi:MAG TPA: zonular occludens toxin domain-containing protein [Opitutaceae bacterium]|nr:zonular occludens toxin domain-containing protein [Opitutaceae bacterium]